MWFCFSMNSKKKVLRYGSVEVVDRIEANKAGGVK
jgi:hypothetical protein